MTPAVALRADQGVVISRIVEPSRSQITSRVIKAECSGTESFIIEITLTIKKEKRANEVRAFHNRQLVDLRSLHLNPYDFRTPQIINAQPFQCFGNKGDDGVLWRLTTYQAIRDAGETDVFATVTKEKGAWVMKYGERDPASSTPQ